MNMGRVALSLAAVASITLSAGCTSGGSSSPQSDEPIPVAATQPGNGTLRIALSTPAGDLDPQNYAGVWGVQSLIFEPLVKYTGEGKLEPGLATSFKVSPDGKRYTFTLREGVRFTDGTPLDAKALQWNLDRWIKSPDNDFLGINQYYSSGKVVDDSTYELTLKRAYPPALQELSYVRPVRLLSPTSVTASGQYDKPIGTGPYTLVSSSDTETVLARNEQYWGAKPVPGKIVLPTIYDAQSRLSALRSGQVDVIGGEYTAPLTTRDATTLRGAPGVKVIGAPGTETLMVAFNNTRAPFDDPAVRQAVGLVIDRTAIAKTLFAGQAQPTSNLFSKDVPYSGERRPIAPTDVAKAKALLGGRTFKVTMVASEEALPGARAVAEVIQQEMKEIGFDVSIKLLDHASNHDELPKREYDLAFFRTLSAPYDPFTSLTDLFDTRIASGTDGKIFLSPELDKLIDTALQATNDTARTAAYQAVYDYLDEQHALVPIVELPRLWAYGNNALRIELPPTEYELPWQSAAVKATS